MFSTSPDFTGLHQDPIHHLISKDLSTMTGVCSICGPVKLARSKSFKYVTCGFKRNLYMKDYKVYNRHDGKYRIHLKKTCQRCGFVPEDISQLDIHHKDGDHKNDKPENLDTLCKNCHVVITKKQAFIKSMTKQMAARIVWVWEQVS